MAAILTGIGLFAEREWARRAWLACITFYLLFHAGWWLLDRDAWLPPVILLGITVLSWVELTRPENKKLFD